MAEPLARETQKLYGLPLSEFTAARNARAKALKQQDPELAAAVAALPKPSVAAGALNELAREDPSEVRALIQSGKRLRAAQEAAVAGKSGADLNEAVAEHRAALDRVTRDLRRRKLSGATLEKATQTLRVASIDPELWPLLERGALHEDLAASGFGLDPAIVARRRKRRSRRPRSGRAKRRARSSAPPRRSSGRGDGSRAPDTRREPTTRGYSRQQFIGGQEGSDGSADRRHGTRLRGGQHRRADQLPRVGRRLVGCPLLASEGLHAGVHDRAGLYGEDQARVRPARRQGGRAIGRPDRPARGLGQGHRGDAGTGAQLSDHRR